MSRCNSCQVNRHRYKRKQQIVEYLGGECIECGYQKSVTALHAHHLEPTKKKFNISGSHARSWEVVKTELDKCVLLCSNCHSELEYGVVPVSGGIPAIL